MGKHWLRQSFQQDQIIPIQVSIKIFITSQRTNRGNKNSGNGKVRFGWTGPTIQWGPPQGGPLFPQNFHLNWSLLSIECFHSCGQHLCKFIESKESVCIRKELNYQRIGLGHQHGHHFIVFGHQYGHCDVVWKHSIVRLKLLEMLA